MVKSTEDIKVEQRVEDPRELPFWDHLSTSARRRILRSGLSAEARARIPGPQTVTLPGTPLQPFSAVVPGQPVNVRVNNPAEDTGSPDTTQSECSLAVHIPNIVVSFNDSNPAASFSGYANSTDAGITFTDDGAVSAPAGEDGDGVLTVTSNGARFHIANITGAYPSYNVGVATSTNGGATFAAPVTVSNLAGGTQMADKPWLACDRTGLASDGNLYLAWTNFLRTAGGGQAILFSRSTDNNTTWSAPLQLSTTGYPQGSQVAVAPNGTVYVAWTDWQSTSKIMLMRSTDNGQTFTNPQPGAATTPVVTFTPPSNPMNGGFEAPAFSSLAVGPDGTVYIVYAAKNGTDNADIYLVRSTDQGRHWSAPLRVNDDATTTDQWMPAVAVTTNNVVGVMFYDRRNDPSNLNIDLYLAMSLDSGVTFLPNRRMTSQAFPPVVNFDPRIRNGYMGDYNQMVAAGTRFYLTWGDNRDTVGTRNDPDAFFLAIGTEDCYVRDSPADDGTVPSAAGQAYQSPDILPAMNPSVFGTLNPINVQVHNFGPKDASNVTVNLYWADPCTLIPRSAWNATRFTVNGAPGNSQVLASVPAGGAVTTPVPFVWNPPDPTTATQNGHFCLLAEIYSAGDPLTYPAAGGWQTIERDNNLAVRNTHVNAAAGPSVIHFNVGALDEAIETHLTIDNRGVPLHMRQTLVLEHSIAAKARFGHLAHHPEEIKLLEGDQWKRDEVIEELQTFRHGERGVGVKLPPNRVVHIRGLHIPAKQPSHAELHIDRTDPQHPIQDGQLRVTQQITQRIGHREVDLTVGGLLYLLRGVPAVDKIAGNGHGGPDLLK